MGAGEQNGDGVSGRAANPWLVPAIFFALTFPTLATWLYFIQFAGSPSVRVFYGVGKVAQFCFPLLYVGLVERGTARLWPKASGGAPTANVRGSLWMGLAVGLAIVGLMFALYFGFFRTSQIFRGVPGEVRSKLSDAGIDSPAGFLGLAVFYSLLHSFLEEYYWRWFVFGRLRYILPLWSAMVISSLGFMAHHTLVIGKYFQGVSPMTVLLSAGVAIGGAIWAWLYERSRLLYASWLSHLLVDAGLMAIGYEMIWGF